MHVSMLSDMFSGKQAGRRAGGQAGRRAVNFINTPINTANWSDNHAAYQPILTDS